MNSEDKQLDELLRKIDVPVDLKSRLRQIADPVASEDDLPRPINKNPERNRRSVLPWAVAISVAASLAACGVYFQWFSGPTPSTPAPSRLASQADPIIPSVISGQSNTPTPAAVLSEIELLEQQIAANDLMINSMQMQNQIDLLDQQLSDLNRASRSNVRNGLASSRGLPSREEASLILTLTNESALQLGVNHSVISESLNLIVEQFPETIGSNRAQQILNTKL
jgi:hypothetical protein